MKRVADNAMSKVDRREFLKLVGAGGVGVGAGFMLAESIKHPVEHLIPYSVPTRGVQCGNRHVVQLCLWDVSCGLRHFCAYTRGVAPRKSKVIRCIRSTRAGFVPSARQDCRCSITRTGSLGRCCSTVTAVATASCKSPGKTGFREWRTTPG